jgi:ATP-dependent Lon protease
MEVIRIAGYTEDEKIQIAKKFLIPKQIVNNGLKKNEISFNKLNVSSIIRNYTREAGVRNLEKEIAKICRKSVKVLEISRKTKINLDKKTINNFLGVEKFRKNETEKKNLIGVTNGLAWTEAGGELLSIEVLLSLGKGKLTITGKLGDVMKESVQAATSYVKSQATNLGINPKDFEKYDIHVHVPEGATPKDGPSAGIAIFNSLASSFTSIKIKKDVAMTGEITLRGRVLPIGGLKEKLYAAVRAGIKTVLIPEDNTKDLSEINKNILNSLNVISISEAKSVLDFSLTKSIIPKVFSESEKFKRPKTPISRENLSESTTH